MNQNLIDIYNTMLSIEVHGQSVLMLADCIRALRQVIDEEQKGTQEN